MKRSKREQSEVDTEAFIRQTTCQLCVATGEGGEKESVTFQGVTTYYCPRCSTFAQYVQNAGRFWRRQGEQEQN